MKFNFKKITTVLASAVMLTGLTLAAPVALASEYPEPFVTDNARDTAIVTTSGNHPTAAVDINAADDLKEALNDIDIDWDEPVIGIGVGEESVNLGEIGSDLYLKSNISEAISTLYDRDDELPTLLASQDVNGEDYDQELTLGDNTIEFDALDNEEDYVVDDEDLNPVLYIDQEDGMAWGLTVDFEDDFNATDEAGEEIVIAGKTFTIDANLGTGEDLVLYASTETVTLGYQESQTVDLGDNEYEIEVTGGRRLDEDEPEATITIDGDSYRKEAGEEISIGDDEFYVNDIFVDTLGEQSTMSVELFVGAEKIEIGESLDYVSVSDEEYESVKANFTGDGIDKIDKIDFEFHPGGLNYDEELDDDRYNSLEMGYSVVDPVIGTIAMNFDSASQGFTEDKSLVDLEVVGSDSLDVSFTNEAGDEYSQTILDENEFDILTNFTSLDRDNTRDNFIFQEDSRETTTHIAEISSVDRGSGDVIEGVGISYEGYEREYGIDDDEGVELVRSEDDLYLCYGLNGTDVAVNTSFSIQKGECGYDATNEQVYEVYDGSMIIHAENDVIINLTDVEEGVTSSNITVKESESHDDLSEDNNLTFNLTWEDDEYSITFDEENAQGSEDEEGDYGYYLTELGSYIETEADDYSWAKIHTPEEQVTYNVLVGSSEEAEDDDVVEEPQVTIVTDDEVDTVSDKNLIVIGGSCINEAAATILGIDYPACGEAFTDATGVEDGESIIKTIESPWNEDKVAVLVAGYNADETEDAVGRLMDDHSTEVDTEVIYPIEA